VQPELRKLIQDAILQARAELMIYDCGIRARRKAAIHELENCIDSFIASVIKVLYKSTGDSNVQAGAFQVGFVNPYNEDQFIKIVRNSSEDSHDARSTRELMKLGLCSWQQLPVVRCFAMETVLGHDVYIVERCTQTLWEYYCTEMDDLDTVSVAFEDTLKEAIGAEVSDLHDNNIMQTKDGRWVIIDCFIEYP
jgi:hypothetical protein